MTKGEVIFGRWRVMSICDNCSYNAGEATFGDSWYTDNKLPCCPKCGKRKPWISKTMRRVSVRKGGFWIFKTYEDTWEQRE